MSSIFLGKPLHWVLLIAITAGLWYVGGLRLHVIHFNAFVMGVLAIGTVCVLIVLYGTRPGDRITRDEIMPDETEARLEDR